MVVRGLTCWPNWLGLVMLLGLITTELAPVTLNCNVTCCPALTVLGVAVKLLITGKSVKLLTTFTVAEAVGGVPEVPVAVRV